MLADETVDDGEPIRVRNIIIQIRRYGINHILPCGQVTQIRDMGRLSRSAQRAGRTACALVMIM